MNSLMKTLAVSVLAMSAGSVAMAQTDVANLTCGAFMGQPDDAARLETAHAVLMWIADTANFEAVGPLERYKMEPVQEGTSTESDTTTANTGWTDDEMSTMIRARCFHQPEDANVITRLKGQD